MDQFTTNPKRGRFTQAALLAWLGATSINNVAANTEETFKLYINKSENPNNYVVLKNEFSTVMKHTSEGMELEFPGVDISFQCTSNVEADERVDDRCTILVSQGTVSAPTPTPTPTPDPDPVVNPSPTPDPDPVDNTPPPVNNNGECQTSATITCSSADIGPAGSYRPDSSIVNIEAGDTLVFKHTVGSGDSGGGGRWSTTFAQNSTAPNGAVLRAWISKTPGGQDVEEGGCKKRGTNGSLYTSTTSTSSSFCQIKPNTVYWLNLKACTGSVYDRTCASGAPADGRTQIYLTWN